MPDDKHQIVSLYELWTNDNITNGEFIAWAMFLKTVESSGKTEITVPKTLEPVALKLGLMGMPAGSIQ